MNTLKIVGLCLLVAAAANAQTYTMLDVTGFLYESDNSAGIVGFPPSDPGDILTGVGFVQSIGAELDWNLEIHQLTWLVSDLTSLGQSDLGNGLMLITYDGGTLDIVADAYTSPGYTIPAYGVEPPNATAPATFSDGEVFLHGEFYSFLMVYDTFKKSGFYEGHLFFVGGTQLGSTAGSAEAYTVAGTVGPEHAPVPGGYDLETVGHITFDVELEPEYNTWGQVKALYR
ncbi:MAG: hypothetical protein ABIF77_10850 [bacterium]